MTKNTNFTSISTFKGSTTAFVVVRDETARAPSGADNNYEDPGTAHVACVQLPAEIADAFEHFVTNDKRRKRPAMVREYLPALAGMLRVGGDVDKYSKLALAMAPHVTAFRHVFERMMLVEDFLRGKSLTCPLVWNLVHVPQWASATVADLGPFRSYFMAVRAQWFFDDGLVEMGDSPDDGYTNYALARAQNFVTRLLWDALSTSP